MKQLPDDSRLCRAIDEIGLSRRPAVAFIFLELIGWAWQKGSAGPVFSTAGWSIFNQT